MKFDGSKNPIPVSPRDSRENGKWSELKKSFIKKCSKVGADDLRSLISKFLMNAPDFI